MRNLSNPLPESGNELHNHFMADVALSPDLAPILALHRHDDGYIAFAAARDAGEDFRPLVSIRADELARYFPSFREQLLKDSYVSINAGWRVRKYGKDGAAYGIPLHRTDRLRYLCAAYCDIDFYKIGLTFGQALGRVIEAQDAGGLPRASIIVRSGRGMWLIFLLHDPKDTSRAPGAFPEKLELYFKLQRAIFSRLSTLGADPVAKDAARYCRVPGSLHTGSEQYAQWWIQGEGPAAYSYSLPQLCQLFGVEAPVRHAKERAAIDCPDKEKHRRGWKALNARRLSQFSLLRSMRGGFSQGTRNSAAMIYAWLLRVNGVPRHDAAVEVNIMGSECRPPLTPAECRGAVKTGFGPRMARMLDQTISDRLEVTVNEAVTIECLPASKFIVDAPAAPTVPAASEIQARTILERREAITRIIAELGTIPPLREMGRRLIVAGFSGSPRTIFLDYQALRIESNRTRASREAERAKQLVLSES